jgi:hypothetical protein
MNSFFIPTMGLGSKRCLDPRIVARIDGGEPNFSLETITLVDKLLSCWFAGSNPHWGQEHRGLRPANPFEACHLACSQLAETTAWAG